MDSKEAHNSTSQMQIDLENQKRMRQQRDIENQKQIDTWLKKDPSCKEKLLKLGMIDEQDRVIPGIWIPQLEFRMPTVTIEREKITPKKGIDGELKKKNETITYQQSEIDDLEKTIRVDSSPHQIEDPFKVRQTNFSNSQTRRGTISDHT